MNTYKHQRVYDPAKKTIVCLENFPDLTEDDGPYIGREVRLHYLILQKILLTGWILPLAISNIFNIRSRPRSLLSENDAHVFLEEERQPVAHRPSFGSYFQLRNLLWADLKARSVSYAKQLGHALVFPSQKGQGILVNPRGIIFPMQKYPGYFSRSLSRVQVSTMAVKDELIVAGGFYGELICKYLNKPGVSFATKIATDETAITNSVDISYSTSGAMRVMTANNDALIRVFDAKSFTCVDNFSFPCPDGKLLAVIGDSTECLIADAQSGKEINKMKGHVDYSFASARHPNGQIVATGNQDTTCRFWDIRNPSESLAVLKGRMGAIRAIRSTLNTTRMSATMMKPQIFEATPNKAVFQEKMYRGCGAICCANSMSSGAGVAGGESKVVFVFSLPVKTSNSRH
ncbi:uncharacterized WD repeat-containing protein isoform X4 [Tanacetum coccineum]